MAIECPSCSMTTCHYCGNCGLCFACCECDDSPTPDEVDPDLAKWREGTPDNGWELGPHRFTGMYQVAA